jgi:hypothetical protein
MKLFPSLCHPGTGLIIVPHHISLKIRLNVIHRLSLWLSHRNPTCIYLLSHAQCRFILLDLAILTILGEARKLWRSPLCSFLQPITIASLLGPKFLLSTLLENTLSLRSSLNARDKCSYAYKTAGKKYSFVNTDCYSCLDRRRRDGASYAWPLFCIAVSRNLENWWEWNGQASSIDRIAVLLAERSVWRHTQRSSSISLMRGGR